MVTQNREQLKVWFKKGAYPTAAQFADLIDSFYHKNDTFQISMVDKLADQLNGKYSQESGEALEAEHNALVVEFVQHKTVSNEKFNGIYDKIDVLEDGVSTLQTKVSDIGMMLKNGATIEQAKAALTALGADYKDVYSIASTLKTFLASTDTVNATINTWAEIEHFLGGISDTTSLTALLVEMEAKIIAAVDTVRNDVLSGIDFQGEGNVVTNITHDQTTKRMTVVKGTVEGGGSGGGLFINDKTVENLELATDVAKGDLVMCNSACDFDTSGVLHNELPGIVKSVMGMAWSGDGVYLAMASTNVGVQIYKRTVHAFAKLSTPILSVIHGTACAFTSDGTLLALSHSKTPYVSVFKREGDTFTELPALPALASYARHCSITSDGSHIAATHNNATEPISLYKRNGDTFTKIAIEKDGTTGNGTAFSADGTYLAFAREGDDNRICIYKRNGDAYEKLPYPAALPGAPRCCVFLNGSQYLAVAHYRAPCIAIYKRDGDTFTLLTTYIKSESPPSHGIGLTASADGVYLTVTPGGYKRFRTFKRRGDNFIQLPDYDPTNTEWVGCAFSPDGMYLTMSRDYDGNVWMRKATRNTNKVSAGIIKTDITNGRGVALEAGGAGETKPILMLEKYV